MISPWEGGKPPRVWAYEICCGESVIDDVPQRYRALVQAHINITMGMARFWVDFIIAGPDRLTRNNRLRKCPKGMRTAVENEVRAEWDRRSTQDKGVSKNENT